MRRRTDMKNVIKNMRYDEERALYNLKDTRVEDCVFAGEADGESVLKEARNIELEGCSFSLRYPLWHVGTFSMQSSKLDTLTRAPIWYSENVKIENCEINGTKAVRECKNVEAKNSKIVSAEFGWKCDGVTLLDTEIESEYLFLDSKNIRLDGVKMKGKYSFQYVEGLVIENSYLDTKDAFWHAKNITVKNSTVKGEYLAWFSDGLTLINCKIIGTQPLCYCKNLTLVDCEMVDTDLSFEYSDVSATVNGNIVSVKNPKSGTITADGVGEIIFGDAVTECTGKVFIREK